MLSTMFASGRLSCGHRANRGLACSTLHPTSITPHNIHDHHCQLPNQLLSIAQYGVGHFNLLNPKPKHIFGRGRGRARPRPGRAGLGGARLGRSGRGRARLCVQGPISRFNWTTVCPEVGYVGHKRRAPSQQPNRGMCASYQSIARGVNSFDLPWSMDEWTMGASP